MMVMASMRKGRGVRKNAKKQEEYRKPMTKFTSNQDILEH